MRFSQLFSPTLKETPADAETPSHKLMLRAGLIRKLSSGIYVYLPTAVHVLEKISQIIREELNRIGAQEVLMPVLHPKELWQQTGRWEKVDVLFRLKDRSQRDFLLGPTHEEVITWLVAHEIKSYRQLPLLLYQIQTKFRDEPRPRGGIIRAREFIMMDLYSFHRTKEDLEKTYQQVYDAYVRIYKRCGFQIRIIEGETGDIGGDISHQFELITPSGEDNVILCSQCDYGADFFTAKFQRKEPATPSEFAESLQKVHTPNVKTIDQLLAFPTFRGMKPSQFIKTILYKTENELIAVCVRGDRVVNEMKLKRYLGVKKLAPATEEEAKGVPLGFIGPIGLNPNIRIIGDLDIKGMKDAICGANEKDYHFQHAAYGRDFTLKEIADVRMAAAGDPCPLCGAPLEMKNGIELGQIFNLGTIYSEPLNCTFLEEDGSVKPMIMGCYGIGVSRMLASIIEQCHDENGIQWPVSIAPYDVVVVPINTQEKTQTAVAEKIYQELQEKGLSVVLDDRDVRAGVKFKDADLIGFPFRINVGRDAANGKVELRIRKSNDTLTVETNTVVEKLLKLRKEALQNLNPEPVLTASHSL
jgi:prolyl-tRNA synthetase